MMVELTLHRDKDYHTIWLQDSKEAHAVVNRLLSPGFETVAITGYERKVKYDSITGLESTVRFLPKTLYINEFVLAVEVTEHPDEKL